MIESKSKWLRCVTSDRGSVSRSTDRAAEPPYIQRGWLAGAELRGSMGDSMFEAIDAEGLFAKHA